MENNSYEEYIRSVLGYPSGNMQDYYQDSNYRGNYDNYNMPNQTQYNGYMQENYEMNRNYELEECYPEIYKIVYPMIQKACNNRTGEVTKDDIDKMVEEIYNNIEGNEQYNVNINVNNKIENLNSTRYFNGKKVVAEPIRPTNSNQNININMEEKSQIGIDNKTIQNNNNRLVEPEQSRETRQCKNCDRGLRDIIRILILRELIGRPGIPNFPGHRPPFPPPGRPPFPPPGRPPFSNPPFRPGTNPFNNF